MAGSRKCVAQMAGCVAQMAGPDGCPAGAMAALLTGPGQAAATSSFQLLGSQRSTSATAWALPFCTPAAEEESSSAFGPFLSDVQAGPACAALGALITASQASDVGADSLAATGLASCTWGVIPEWNNASTSAASDLTVTFALDKPTRVFVSGLLWKNYALSIDGSAISQFGATLDLLLWNGASLEPILSSDDGALGSPDPFALSAVLQPGLYVIVLVATSAVSLQGTTELVVVESGFDVEFAPAAPADLTGDGAVDGADVGLLLAAWGGCGGCSPFDCPADLTGDCTVDGADLGSVLAAWGNAG